MIYFLLAPATAPRDVTPVAVEQTPSWVSLSWQPPRQTNGQITGQIILEFSLSLAHCYLICTVCFI